MDKYGQVWTGKFYLGSSPASTYRPSTIPSTYRYLTI